MPILHSCALLNVGAVILVTGREKQDGFGIGRHWYVLLRIFDSNTDISSKSTLLVLKVLTNFRI